MKAVITGATGFIGSHVVEHFLQKGMQVSCLLRPSRSSLSWLAGLPVHICHADLTDSSALAPLITDADYVVHLAGVTKAVKDSEFTIGNVETTRALLEALQRSRSLRKFCLISSLAAAGPSPGPEPIDEASPPRPITPYGESKLAAEQLCLAARATVPVVIIRPPAVYGPRDRDIFHLFRWVSFGLFPHTGPANKELSVLHVRDCARAVFAATVHGDSCGKTYFVANASPYRLRHIAATIATLMGKRLIELRLPKWAATVISALSQAAAAPFGKPAVLSFDKVRDLYALRWTCNPARIRREVGFQEELSLEDGVRDTIDWYRASNWL